LVEREVGLEKLGGLEGQEVKLAFREELGTQSFAVATFDELAWGAEGRKAASNALAGDSGLLPGIVSRPDRVTGGEDERAARTS